MCRRMTNTSSNKILYANLSYVLTGICFDAHNSIGRYAKEKTYSDFIEDALSFKNIPFEREYFISSTNEKADFMIQDSIILEIKAKELTLKEDYYQLQRYLHSCNKKLGLLINFRNRYLKPIRVINPDITL